VIKPLGPPKFTQGKKPREPGSPTPLLPLERRVPQERGVDKNGEKFTPKGSRLRDLKIRKREPKHFRKFTIGVKRVILKPGKKRVFPNNPPKWP